MGKKIHCRIDPATGRGIYIHIPFCRQACRYCDFYFTVSLRYVDRFMESLETEIRERHNEMPGNVPVTSIYLGGGTPSLMHPVHIDKVMDLVFRYYQVTESAEITIECNPDDLTPEHLKFLRERGFNRLSIGVQSFHDRDLELLKRSHDSDRAVNSILDAASAGFGNMNIDLIYGIPGQTEDNWRENLDRLASLPVEHLSAYHLTFERGTVFDHWRKQGRLVPVREQLSESLYRILCKNMEERGFEHYEISNFAHKGNHSRHNLVYWTGAAYQGYGPSAHSYNGKQRSWNVSSLEKYTEGITRGETVREREELTSDEAYHDYLITSLRTCRGADPGWISEQFGASVRSHFDRAAARLFSAGLLENREGKVIIPPARWLITDHILRELFLDVI